MGAVFGSMSGVVTGSIGGILGKSAETVATSYVSEKAGTIVTDSIYEELKED